jgi:excisionase family DNA binding protein
LSTHDNQLKPISYSVEEISRVNNIGRTSIYKALGEGKLRGMKLGRKTLILESDFREFLASLPPFQSRGSVTGGR